MSFTGASMNLTYPEHLEQVLFGDYKTLKLLFFFNGALGDLFEGRVVCVCDGSARSKLVRFRWHA